MNSSRWKIIQAAIVAIVVLFGGWVGYSIHVRTSEQGRVNNSTTDTLSGQEYNVNQIAADNAPNPSVPYFLGTDQLIKMGITSSDIRYIQDVIAHYVVYEEKLHFAKVSIVSDSYELKSSLGDPNKVYSVKFGVNDNSDYQALVTSNFIKRTIKIDLLKSDKQVYSKSFTVYNG